MSLNSKNINTESKIPKLIPSNKLRNAGWSLNLPRGSSSSMPVKSADKTVQPATNRKAFRLDLSSLDSTINIVEVKAPTTLEYLMKPGKAFLNEIIHKVNTYVTPDQKSRFARVGNQKSPTLSELHNFPGDSETSSSSGDDTDAGAEPPPARKLYKPRPEKTLTAARKIMYRNTPGTTEKKPPFTCDTDVLAMEQEFESFLKTPVPAGPTNRTGAVKTSKEPLKKDKVPSRPGGVTQSDPNRTNPIVRVKSHVLPKEENWFKLAPAKRELSANIATQKKTNPLRRNNDIPSRKPTSSKAPKKPDAQTKEAKNLINNSSSRPKSIRGRKQKIPPDDGCRSQMPPEEPAVTESPIHADKLLNVQERIEKLRASNQELKNTVCRLLRTNTDEGILAKAKDGCGVGRVGGVLVKAAQSLEGMQPFASKAMRDRMLTNVVKDFAVVSM